MSSLKNHPEIQDIDFVTQVNREPFDLLVNFVTFGLLRLGAIVLSTCVLVLRESDSSWVTQPTRLLEELECV